MIKFLASLLIIVVSCSGAEGQSRTVGNTDSLAPSALKPVGRFRLSETNGLELISTAVHFGFSFTGRECKVYLSLHDSAAHNYLQYELDGTYQERVYVSAGRNSPLIITVPRDGTHHVEIYKTTEAFTGPIFITGISAKKIKAEIPRSAPLIEFIGNSITCGAAADTSGFACSAGTYHDHHNGYMAYGPRLARALGADFVVTSVSGIGIYRTWNQDSPSMPQLYENTDLHPGAEDKWDFSRFSPRIVSIALGTNDLSNGDGKTPRNPFDSVVFVTAYVKFVGLIKSRYPKAQIVLLGSPMIRDSGRILLQNCLLAIKRETDATDKSGTPVSTFFFKSASPHGCGFHPSVSDHALMAAELKPLFKKLLARSGG